MIYITKTNTFKPFFFFFNKQIKCVGYVMFWKLQVTRKPCSLRCHDTCILALIWTFDPVVTWSMHFSPPRRFTHNASFFPSKKWSMCTVWQSPWISRFIINLMTVLVQVIMTGGSHRGAKKHSWLWITLQTFRLIHIMDHTTIPATHCLGVIPRFKGLTGKDYQQLLSAWN